MIPDDVTVQVLTQAREHIIKQDLRGGQGRQARECHRAPVQFHLNGTARAGLPQIKGRDHSRSLWTARSCCKKLSESRRRRITGSNTPRRALPARKWIMPWKCATPCSMSGSQRADNKVIINLPVTVEMSMPHVYASQIEYMCKHLNYRENVIVSLHPHNDRGCGVADTRDGSAGRRRPHRGHALRQRRAHRQRGHRHPGDEHVFPWAWIRSSISAICRISSMSMNSVTRMKVGYRQPYAGQLVFAAFTGSHQDAIAKGMHWREEHDATQLDRAISCRSTRSDVGRVYETDVIRINSQSGKGGVAYMLDRILWL